MSKRNRSQPADNWKPSKKKSVERIDGIIALIMALDRASRGRESIYEKHGPLFLTVGDESQYGEDDDWALPTAPPNTRRLRCKRITSTYLHVAVEDDGVGNLFE